MILALIMTWLELGLAWSAPGGSAAQPRPVADMIIHTSERSCAGVLEIDAVLTDRMKWTRAWIEKIDDVVQNHITFPVLVMGPVTALTAPADVAATPFREGIVAVKGRISGTVVGSAWPRRSFSAWSASFARPCGEAGPCLPEQAEKSEAPFAIDDAGGFRFAFQGSFHGNDHFELHFGPPLDHTIHIVRGAGGRITAETAETGKEICDLQFRLGQGAGNRPAVPQKPRIDKPRLRHPRRDSPPPPTPLEFPRLP